MVVLSRHMSAQHMRCVNNNVHHYQVMNYTWQLKQSLQTEKHQFYYGSSSKTRTGTCESLGKDIYMLNGN